MSKDELKLEILNSITQDVENWVNLQGTFTNGYDYETAYATFAARINNTILQKSLGSLSRSRNSKKNSTPVLGSLK